MTVPDFARLLGREPAQVEPLIDHGYRAVWRVTAGEQTFAVKASAAAGHVSGELQKHLHAERGGVPVPEVVGYLAGPVPCLAICWVDGVALDQLTGRASWEAAGAILRRIHDRPVLEPGARPWGETAIAWLHRDIGFLVQRGAVTAAERDAALTNARALQPLLDATDATWLHGDCQAAHFLLDRETGEVAAVIDWADASAGAPDMDFAVLSIAHEDRLPALLDGYGASAALRERLAVTLPFHRALRGAMAAPWLESHGFLGVQWPGEAVRALARGHTSW
ncbi:MAG: phosphotransferase family protein [Dehalococcoidia bacterium]